MTIQAVVINTHSDPDAMVFSKDSTRTTRAKPFVTATMDLTTGLASS